MSREIKFRAWLPDMGAMIHSDNPDSMNEADAYFNLETNGLQVFTIESCNDDTECYSEKYDDAVLMQFTGLHDKHGTEIYEGDIVKLNDGTQGEEIKAVEFINGGFHVSDGEYIAPVFAYASDMPEFSRVEVIGNIHENPELLEAGE